MERRYSCPLGTAGFCDVKPLPLPLVGSFGERAFWLESIGKLAHYSTAALRLFPIDHLWLHTKGLEPQAKVWENTVEGFAHDNKP